MFSVIDLIVDIDGVGIWWEWQPSRLLYDNWLLGECRRVVRTHIRPPVHPVERPYRLSRAYSRVCGQQVGADVPTAQQPVY